MESEEEVRLDTEHTQQHHPLRVIVAVRPFLDTDGVAPRSRGLQAISSNGNQLFLRAYDNHHSASSLQSKEYKSFVFDHIHDFTGDDDDDESDDSDESDDDSDTLEAIYSPLLKELVSPKDFQSNVILYGASNTGKSHLLFNTDIGLIPAFASKIFTENVGVMISAVLHDSGGQHSSSRDLFSSNYNEIQYKLHESVLVFPSLTSVQLYQEQDALQALDTIHASAAALVISNNLMHAQSTLVIRFTIEHDETVRFVNFIDLAAGSTSDSVPNFFNRKICENATGRRVQDNLTQCNSLPAVLLDQALINGKTSVIATVDPCSLQYQQTLCTLRHASLLQTLCTRETPPTTVVSIIEDLRLRIAELQEQRPEETHSVSCTKTSVPKKKDLKQRQVEMLKEQQDTLVEQHNELENLIRLVEKIGRHSAIALETVVQDTTEKQVALLGATARVDNTTTCSKVLRRLHEDSWISEKVWYELSECVTLAATTTNSSTTIEDTSDNAMPALLPPPDIVLFGGGTELKSSHATVTMTLDDNTISITACSDNGEVLVNGNRIPPRIAFELVDGDRICLGPRNVFIVEVNQDSTRHTWSYCIEELLRPPQNVYSKLAISNSKTAHELLVERIASIRTLHEAVPTAMEAEAAYDEDIDASSHVMESDMKTVGGKKSMSKTGGGVVLGMTTRHRRTTMKRFSTAMQSEMDDLQESLFDSQVNVLFLYVKEANAMALDLEKDVVFSVTPAVNHAVTRSLEEEDIDELQTDLFIKVLNLNDQSHPIMITKNEFVAKVREMRTYYESERTKEEDTEQLSDDTTDDEQLDNPFFFESQDILIGKATLYIGGLNYLLALDEILPIIDRTGKVNGELVVSVTPCISVENSDDDDEEERYEPYRQTNLDVEEEQLQEYHGKRLSFRITISGARGLPIKCNSNVFCQYHFYCDETPTCTRRSEVKTVHPVFNETFSHNVMIHEDFILYIMSEHIDIEVFGTRGNQMQEEKLREASVQEELYWAELDKQEMAEAIEILQEELRGRDESSSDVKRVRSPPASRNTATRERHQRPQSNNQSYRRESNTAGSRNSNSPSSPTNVKKLVKELQIARAERDEAKATLLKLQNKTSKNIFKRKGTSKSSKQLQKKSSKNIFKRSGASSKSVEESQKSSSRRMDMMSSRSSMKYDDDDANDDIKVSDEGNNNNVEGSSTTCTLQ